MDRFSGPEITGEMIEKVICAKDDGAMALWLTRSKGVWHLVVVGGVDGSEEHVLTAATVLSQTPRLKEPDWFVHTMAAGFFNSMFFDPRGSRR